MSTRGKIVLLTATTRHRRLNTTIDTSSVDMSFVPFSETSNVTHRQRGDTEITNFIVKGQANAQERVGSCKRPCSTIEMQVLQTRVCSDSIVLSVFVHLSCLSQRGGEAIGYTSPKGWR